MTTLRRTYRLKIAEVLKDFLIEDGTLVDALADATIALADETGESAQSAVIGVVSRATGIVAIPPAEYTRIEQIHQLIKFYGKAEVEKAFRFSYQQWIATKRAKGGTYSRINFGWVDWAQENLMQDKTNNEPKKPQPVKIILAGGQIVDGVA